MPRIFPSKPYIAAYLRGRAGGFSPLDLSPVAWWDGTDASTMNTVSGGSGSTPGIGDDVARWVDKASGYILNGGSAGTLHADGVAFSSSRLQESTDSRTLFKFMHDGTGGSCLFAAVVDTDASRDLIAETNNVGASNVGFGILRENGTGTDDFLRGVITNGSNIWDEGDFAGAPFESGTLRAGALVVGASNVTQYVDQEPPVSAAPSGALSSANHTQRLSVGNRQTGGLNMIGKIKHLVFVNRTITAEEYETFRAWALS